jgi:flagellar biosynthesis chaperone FliJ
MTDEELADYIHELSDILHERLQAQGAENNWLKRQLEVRSWSTWRQRASRGVLGLAGHQ